ncbi:MAG: hypothetical protein NZ901_12570 [Geminocystis sp.]|nr:hypothetical protein [Geminocystis sp.]MCS7149002.1 hypothetical protein [Geminocystis sp.]MCX8077358.1 hypothetical protein [Geminocystis sp.]MDW8114819.1 hypothetical protein [Geminocystis sp.]MDW8464088.1 hypothetical protein [Geminocystis sp.]
MAERKATSRDTSNNLPVGLPGNGKQLIAYRRQLMTITTRQ